MSYFPPYGHSKNKIEVELDLSNYICLRFFRFRIMQQNLTQKMQQLLIHYNSLKRMI